MRIAPADRALGAVLPPALVVSSMSVPPFKLAAPAALLASGLRSSAMLEARVFPDAADGSTDDETPSNGRMRLAQMNAHLHCSVLGTCLGTAELRKLMSRFVDLRDASDLEVHHDAVGQAGAGGPVARALHKALDQRHSAAIQRFAKARGAKALAALWKESLEQGEIPGAYWAVLTHRDVTSDVRQQVFGDVHMLSHLVGAANRADIRRLVALEGEVAELRERLDRQQERSQGLLDERDRVLEQLKSELVAALGRLARLQSSGSIAPPPSVPHADAASVAAIVARQTERRERAEQASASAAGEIDRLFEELEHARAQAHALGREVAAMESQLDGEGDAGEGQEGALDKQLRGRRILYVGGRPSSAPNIRAVVLRHGGELQRHDGGLEDRKGLLPAAVAWAELVVFPVDCIDHDSANHLKRLCARHGVRFMPLRSAGVASFVAALASADEAIEPHAAGSRPICLKHG